MLERPEIPIHTNGSENELREQVKRRKISGGTRSDKGRICRDSFSSLKKTCKKLGISFLEYLSDRISKLGDLVIEKSQATTTYREVTNINIKLLNYIKKISCNFSITRGRGMIY